jgi:hypothetical protein
MIFVSYSHADDKWRQRFKIISKLLSRFIPKAKEVQFRTMHLLLLVPIIPIVALVLTYITMRGDSPTLYDSDATVQGNMLVVTITNKGKTAKLGEGWCGAGAYLTPGSGRITPLMKAATSDIFRRSFIAPDQQEKFEILVPASVDSKFAAGNPTWLLVNPSTIWAVACVFPYSDSRSKWLKSEALKFSYEVQPTGQGTQRHAVQSTVESTDRIIMALGGPE